MADLPVPKAEAKPSTKSDLVAREVTGHDTGCRCASCWAIRTGFDIGFASGMASGVASGRAQAATDLRQAVAWYPEDVFPADSDNRSAIAGTAMRHAYEQAAQIAESGHRD